MKIVCDACQAKYSISDDKVQGKVFKIRCKKCSNIIVVRGGANAAEAAAPPEQQKETRVYDYGYEGGGGAPAGDESVWHVVINQEQVGPMTAAEVQQRFAGGEIDGETFAWREGFADWLPLAQVDAFAAFVASGSTTAAVGGGGGGGGMSAMFGAGGSDESGTMRSDPGDLFAAASGGGAGEDDGGDLFGSKPKAGGAAAGGASAAANAKLRGERNENSVLFSLNNLAQLASDKPAPAPSGGGGGGASMAGAATGAAGGEGSGLIDIRSMASAYLGPGQGAAAKPSTSAAIGSIDDLPVFGGGGFSDPVALVPSARPSGGNNKMMFILIGSVGLLAVVAIIMVVVMMGKKDTPAAGAGSTVAMGDGSDKKDPDKTDPDKKDPAVADPGKGSSAENGSAEDPTKTDTTKTDTTKTDTTKTDTTKTDTTKVDATKTKTDTTKTKTDTTKTNTTKVDTTKTKTDTTKVDTTKVKTPPPDSGGCDQVSCVVSGYADACCAKYKKTTTPDPNANKPKSDLPDSLDRDMIQKGVGSVKARVMTCGDKSQAKGVVKVGVKVGGDGRVQSVTVKETPDAALGSCVANSMKTASFAKTNTGGTFSIPFTF